LGWREPALALDGGADGLELPFRLVRQARERLVPGGWLLLEAAGAQMPSLRQFLAEQGFDDVRTWADLAGVERVIGGRLPKERS
jgi:release factor glutamine methyltransferase